MSHDFDEQYWENHWRDAGSSDAPNPCLATELAGIVPGLALDAGCGEGAEALWLAEHGWQVTAVDISATALARAWARSAARGLADRVAWVQADLTAWAPSSGLDLVTTHYAHPAMPQADFYDRIAGWVVPGGTLLVVGHGHGAGHGHSGPDADDHGRHRDAGRAQPTAHGTAPEQALVSAPALRERFADRGWEVVTADERVRATCDLDGRPVTLRDVVLRARRPAGPPA
ncbi:MAG TPA: class I SAM-dependent methyltransferase [Candidatus Nanopelagicales bacterium]|nr:class I SAM-dependent methyltransferase [Candidatus Nanopelagicales bacterium]